MRKRMYWGITTLMILIIGAGVFVFIENRRATQQVPETDNQPSIRSGEEVPQPPIPNGQFQNSSTFHVEDPIHRDDPQEIETSDKPKVKWTAPKGAVTKPNFPIVDPKADPVKEAYKRLEYIKNNPYSWGGVHSERATELIAELLPVEVAANHNEGDEEDLLINELCEQGDPRAAEVLIAIMCDGGVGWRLMNETLVEIGPPAVPYILPYLDRFVAQGGTTSVGMFYALRGIGVRYRDDLGGIVQHIIIPKLKVIADDEEYERYNGFCVTVARSALEKLQ